MCERERDDFVRDLRNTKGLSIDVTKGRFSYVYNPSGPCPLIPGNDGNKHLP